MFGYKLKEFQLMWWIVRGAPLLILPGLFFDLEITIVLFSYMFLHIQQGLESIISDYIHDQLTNCIYLVMIRLLMIQSFVYFIEFLL